MNPLILTIFLIVIGLFFIIRNVRYLIYPATLERYLKNSHKGQMWASKFGYEKTLALYRSVLVPVGLAFGLVFAGTGIWFTWIFVQAA